MPYDITMIERLQRFNSSKFPSKIGPEAIEACHIDLECLLERLGVPSKEMVGLGTFYLCDVAYTWWKGIAVTLTALLTRRDAAEALAGRWWCDGIA